MDRVKGKVGDFLSKSGKHDTTVHESVNPAVVHETVKPHEHEQVTTAVDKEIHQDHHHTSVQPVYDQQRLQEQHHIKDLGHDHREIKHGDDANVAAKLQQEQAKFKSERHVAGTTTTRENEPVVTGEHRHHNVHEVIQPVVHKETVEPHVVHSVAKVHEKHDKPAQVHGTSTLPAMNMADFKAHGGSLTGRETRTDGFQGEPHSIGGTHSTHHDPNPVPHGSVPTHGGPEPQHPTGTRGTTGTHGLTGTTGTHGTHGTTGTHGLTGTTGTHGTHGTTATHPTTTTHDTHRSRSSSPKKPGLMDKLNPKVDADGDGKPGFMK